MGTRKTLVFCTSWSDSPLVWQFRYEKWLAHVRQSPLQYEQVLMIDDGSPLLPEIAHLSSVSAEALPSARPQGAAVLVHHNQRLGQFPGCNFPGWWRSFMFAGEYAARYSFDKIVHIESDTYVLSDALIDYINHVEAGWTTLWCPRALCPETCVQVICKDQFASYLSLGKEPYASRYAGVPPEKLLPFTHVESCFKGDRYGEYRTELPLNADYASQVPMSTQTWCGPPPHPKRMLAVSLGGNTIAPHEALYPRDAWTCIGSAMYPDGASLAREIERIPSNTVDAVQVTILAADTAPPSLPLTQLRRVLHTESELLLQLRPTVRTESFKALVQYCFASGFSVQRIAAGVPRRGDFLIAVRDDAASVPALRDERSLIRLRLAATE